MLEVEEQRRLEKPVVDGAEVDDVPAHEPDRESDGGPCDPGEPGAEQVRDPRTHGLGEPHQDQRRRPVRDDHVLQEVGEQQMLHRDRLER